jgi:hypothetical protein
LDLDKQSSLKGVVFGVYQRITGFFSKANRESYEGIIEPERAIKYPIIYFINLYGG